MNDPITIKKSSDRDLYLCSYDYDSIIHFVPVVLCLPAAGKYMKAAESATVNEAPSLVLQCFTASQTGLIGLRSSQFLNAGMPSLLPRPVIDILLPYSIILCLPLFSYMLHSQCPLGAKLFQTAEIRLG